MRPRHQQGSIVKHNGQWLVRYYEDRVENGSAKRVRAAKPLAPVNNTYRTKTHVRSLADEIMRQVNGSQATQLDGTLTLAEFVEQRYFPHLEQRIKMSGELHLEPSTLQGYRDIWHLHGKNSDIASVRVRDFTTVDAQSFLMSLNPTRTHQSHLRIKALATTDWHKYIDRIINDAINMLQFRRLGYTDGLPHHPLWDGVQNLGF